MDDRRFDALTRLLGKGGSRRRILGSLLGIGGAVALGGLTSPAKTDAARRPTSPPTPPGCPGQQVLDGSDCVCPNGLSTCGPDCCTPNGSGAEQSVCCDNACCFGTCYGEELCCPYPRQWCDATGECCPDGTLCCAGIGCRAECACVPSTCEVGQCGEVSDSCDGTLNCGDCDPGFVCSNGQCVDDFNTCREDENACLESGSHCGSGSCSCYPRLEGGTVCVDYFDDDSDDCGWCGGDSECRILMGNFDAVCLAVSSNCENCQGRGACALLCGTPS